MSLGWNADQERPNVVEFSEEIADRFARHADRVVDLLTRSGRKAWPGLKNFPEIGSGFHSLSALDYAISNELPFWCDDRVLRQEAAKASVSSFGTVDLIRAMEARGALTPELAAIARATLIDNFHVDLGFSEPEMRLAAEMASWAPSGAAAAMARSMAWKTDPDASFRFVREAIGQVVGSSPASVEGWVTSAALGLIRIAPGDPVGAGKNLQLLLINLIDQPWIRSDVLPFIVGGIRRARGSDTAIVDPLRPVLESTFRLLSREHGAPAAAEFLLRLVAALGEEDRYAAAYVILMTDV